HEQLGQGGHFGDAGLVAAAVLGDGLADDFQLVGDGREAASGLFRIRAAVGFGLVVAAVGGFFLFLVVVLGRRLVVGLLDDDRLDFLGGQRAVVGVDVAVEHIGKATAFADHALVLGEKIR